MILKENNFFRKMFIVTEYAALMSEFYLAQYLENEFCKALILTIHRFEL